MCLIIMRSALSSVSSPTELHHSGDLVSPVQYASVRHADLELHVHHGCMRCNFRLPFHAVAADGSLHEEREAGSLRILRRNGSRRHYRTDLGAAGCALYEVTGGLNTGLAEALAGGQSAAIYDVCSKTMGGVGIALAMIGVVVCPITSGDTAFRSARLTLSDWFHMDQGSYANRLKLCIPVLGIGAILGIGNATGLIDYTVIWRYFSWTNQTLAMIVLWAAAMYLFTEKKNFWMAAVPATFMSAGFLHLFHPRAGVPRQPAEPARQRTAR